MEGDIVKELLITHNIDLNKQELYESDKKYNIDKIPELRINKNLLEEKIIKKFGESIGKYIMKKTYPINTETVEPYKILNILDLKK